VNAVSSNGYDVLSDRLDGPFPRLRAFVIPGVARALQLRDGSAGFLLVHLATRFNERVERIDPVPDDWGWSPRRIAGTNVWSNHASGTAEDLNSLKHPQGKEALETFSRAQVTEIHRLLDRYDGCIRWGGDYRSTPDAMHFELDRPLAEVIHKAQLLVPTVRGRAVCEANPGLKRLIMGT
jgi:hypothetical protein